MSIACDTDGEGRLFPPDAPSAEQYLGEAGLALILSLRDRVDERVSEHIGAPIARVGCLLSWISGGSPAGAVGTPPHAEPDPVAFNWLTDPLSGTYAPHVDRANRPEYEVSALLYLSTAGVDFTGGHFAFNDADRDRLVAPRAGRLLAFCSGFANLHQVRRVTSGERLVLSTWYQRVAAAGGDGSQD